MSRIRESGHKLLTIQIGSLYGHMNTVSQQLVCTCFYLVEIKMFEELTATVCKPVVMV